MVLTALLAFGLFCQVQSQLCGPGGIFPGLLGAENSIFGSGLQFGSLPQPNFASGPACGVPPTPCGFPSCGVQVPSCGRIPPCGLQSTSGIPASCGLQGSTCGIQSAPCGLQAPVGPSTSCGLQNNLGQIQPCGIQVPYNVAPQCNIAPYGIQAPTINNISPSLIPNQPCSQCQNLIPNQCSQCYTPIAPTVPSLNDYCQNSATVIDNTLANSLANALQLLIVSNLLESGLTPSNGPYVSEINPFCGNVISDFSLSNQVCEPVYEILPYIEVPCYQEAITNFAPCAEISVCDPIYVPEVPFAFNCDNGLISSYSNGFGCSDCGLVNPYNNGFSYDSGLVNPYASSFGISESRGLVNPFANGIGCLDSIFSPVAAEVLFPSEIPAQLTCNFGYMANNVPCVSVNVEALPFESCGCNNVLY